MLNINFVPDDYIQNNESRRANLMYIVLFAVVMAALGGSFMTIKIRQRALGAKEKLVNAKLAHAQDAIKQFEDLQARRKAMMKTALTTAELIEPVPKSLLLASLTNNLPAGVSLLRLNLLQKEPRQVSRPVATSKYDKAQAAKAPASLPEISQEKLLETHIDIEGIAPSDRQVASYIECLSTSSLWNNVALVESKEVKIEDTTYRQFKLTAVLSKEVHLTKDDIERIRTRAENALRVF
ncbi:MAG TPA: PilN domain-containing protein [Sedimentisphaerales bacterium]|nr:PilN domain-containing protein [Sedimentisphaerales bacterium]